MNVNYIKDSIAEHKPKLIILACLIAAFISGFGTGNYDRYGTKTSRRSLNYTTNLSGKPTPTPNSKPSPVATNGAAASGTAASGGGTAECYIKGNIGAGSKKTFHVPGGSFYDRTNAEVCFNTEEEALAAGFTKSSR